MTCHHNSLFSRRITCVEVTANPQLPLLSRSNSIRATRPVISIRRGRPGFGENDKRNVKIIPAPTWGHALETTNDPPSLMSRLFPFASR